MDYVLLKDRCIQHVVPMQCAALDLNQFIVFVVYTDVSVPLVLTWMSIRTNVFTHAVITSDDNIAVIYIPVASDTDLSTTQTNILYSKYNIYAF